MNAKRSHRQDRLAKIYDAEILPVWSERFGRMLLRRVVVPPRAPGAMVLDVGTATGYAALEVLRRMDEPGRVVAIDVSPEMLDVARQKAGTLAGRRIFFRRDRIEPRLAFADDVFDVVMSNATLAELVRPAAAVADFARVARPGGRVVASFPLAGTWAELLDRMREVLLQADRADALGRLDAYLARMPTLEVARAWFEGAGLLDVEVEHRSYRLLFRSSHDFFYAPLIEHGPLAAWKAIAGRGSEVPAVFRALQEAMDAHWAGRPFAVTVRAACVAGRKPLEEERALVAGAAPGAFDDERAGVHRITTGEIEFIEQAGPVEELERVEAAESTWPMVPAVPVADSLSPRADPITVRPRAPGSFAPRGGREAGG